MATMSAQEFNRDVSAAKRAAADGPVIITDRGKPAFVLLTVEEFERITDKRTIVDWLQLDEDIEFEPVPLRSLPRAADL
nr:type II toxin-antitoxin system Phd/YefM family antitoxin [Mycobacterium lacus]